MKVRRSVRLRFWEALCDIIVAGACVEVLHGFER
jgi:hypothetical protein